MLYGIIIVSDDIVFSLQIKQTLETLAPCHRLNYQQIDEVLPNLKCSLVIIDTEKADNKRLIKQIRYKKTIPIIAIIKDTMDGVDWLQAGADVYLTKRSRSEEYWAHANTLLNRFRELSNMQDIDTIICIKERMIIDSARRQVFIDGIHIRLTKSEFNLLYLLATNSGKVMTNRQICDYLWGDNDMTNNDRITCHISRLRKKIEPDPKRPFYIKTIRGVGYKLSKYEL